MTPEILLAGQFGPAALAALVRTWNPSAPAYLMREELPRRQILPKQRLDLVRFELLPANQRDLAAFFSNEAAQAFFAPQTSGRIFCRQGELRWEASQDGKLKAAFVGEETSGVSLPDVQPEHLDERYQRRPERAALLLGTRLQGEEFQRLASSEQESYFAEVRIPRLLRYPHHPTWSAERLQLTYYEYLDRAGACVAVRFTGLAPFSLVCKEKEHESL